MLGRSNRDSHVVQNRDKTKSGSELLQGNATESQHFSIAAHHPMFVVPIAHVLTLDRLPTHEALQALSPSPLVEWNHTLGDVLFISHTWLSVGHPDTACNDKLKLLQTLLHRLVAGRLHIRAHWIAELLWGKEVRCSAAELAPCRYVWMDVMCTYLRRSNSRSRSAASHKP